MQEPINIYMSKPSIADNIKQLMLQQGHKNAKKLAKEVGIPYTTLHAVLNGGQPTVKTLLALASYFNVTLDYMVHGKNTKPENMEDLLSEDIFEGFLKVKIEKIISIKK